MEWENKLHHITPFFFLNLAFESHACIFQWPNKKCWLATNAMSICIGITHICITQVNTSKELFLKQHSTIPIVVFISITWFFLLVNILNQSIQSFLTVHVAYILTRQNICMKDKPALSLARWALKHTTCSTHIVNISILAILSGQGKGLIETCAHVWPHEHLQDIGEKSNAYVALSRKLQGPRASDHG